MKITNKLTFAALAARAVMLLSSTQITLAGVLALLVLPARADTFGSGTNTFTIDFVDIGNPGNGDDLGAGGGSYSTPHGEVAYVYRIGVTEAPQDWITKATNLGLTNVTAGPWIGRQPAADMTWYEAAAFVNWLNTSTGHQPAYDLTYNGGWSMRLWSSGQAWQVGGENLYRHKDAFYFLPSEDEWYKAAWHKNDGVTANYWDYATGSNMIPTPVASGTGAGTVVYNLAESSPPATVDNNGGLSPYGTRGQNGNAGEFNESAFDGLNDAPSESRVRGGGRWYAADQSQLVPSNRNEHDLSFTSHGVGFRVASASVAAVVPGQSLVLAGSRVTLSLTNALNVSSTYQWQFNGTNLMGATEPTLDLSNLTTNHTGFYRVTVSNAYAVVTTAPAVVHVADRVTITAQPQNASVLPGTNVIFSVAAISPLAITYRWQLNGTNLPGATNATLSITNAQFNPHTGYYRVLASDTSSSELSDTANLVVLARPVIINPPVATTLLQGDTAVLSVTATPDHPLLPLSYRWLRSATTYVAQGQSTLTVTNLQTNTTFRVVVTNLAGSLPSTPVTVTVLADNDRDGMADDWESLNGFNPANAGDGALDFDGDGLRNRDEYTAGTDPRDPSSRLKIESLTRLGSNAVVLQFQTVSNRTYTAQFSGETTGSTWTNLAHFDARTTNATEWLTNSFANNAACRFYRLVTPRQP